MYVMWRSPFTRHFYLFFLFYYYQLIAENLPCYINVADNPRHVYFGVNFKLRRISWYLIFAYFFLELFRYSKVPFNTFWGTTPVLGSSIRTTDVFPIVPSAENRIHMPFPFFLQFCCEGRFHLGWQYRWLLFSNFFSLLE